jgi:predicted RNA polymerase sigma factor
VEAKRFEDAAVYLRAEISKDEFGPGETADLCGLLGGVLSELGRMDEAEVAHRDAVERAIASSPGVRTLQVAIARYMLAAHILNCGDAPRALAEVEAALREEERGHDSLYALKAETLRELGRDEGAREAAAAAVRTASSEKMRLALTRRLSALLSNAADAG